MAKSPPSSSILVRKYGGSSLATVERIGAVARDVATCSRAGQGIVVVVSAMGRSTDDLARLARQANPSPPRRELDMLLSVGERITMSLLSMALAAEGCSAISFTGSQCGIITDCSHTDARIIEVRGDRVRQSLADGHVVVVAGFQGVSREKEITTLGRGGSDATAVALAAALGAERCEILKDVDGVMTADPDRLPGVKRHDKLSYEEMTTIAAAGCGVVHHRAVEYAARHDVPIFVGSSFHDTPGTLIEKIDPEVPPPAVEPGEASLCANWKPLVMTVTDDLDLLEIDRLTDESLAGLRLAFSPLQADSSPLAEWFESGRGHRWCILGDPDAIAAMRSAAIRFLGGEESMTSRQGLSCVALTGSKPRSWLEAIAEVSEITGTACVKDAIIRASGDTLRLLAATDVLAGLLEPLHRKLFAD